MIDGLPVIDAIVHAHNFDRKNYANNYAALMAEDTWKVAYATSRPGYRLPREAYIRDWSIDEVAGVAFVESDHDLAVHHVLPIRAFRDGGCSEEKTREINDRWPQRFIVYAGVDPMERQKAIDDLERQVELFSPVGVKLYPNSWAGRKIDGWYMDDPEVAFPVFERAARLGLRVAAVHKALPVGPVARKHYAVDDIEGAAIAFPDLNFEIVHGGMAFLDETAWLLARFPNVWVNLEVTTSLLVGRPGTFAQALSTLLMSPAALDRICWGTGSIGRHPQPLLEEFVRRFKFSDETVESFGVPQMSRVNKRKILSENYARLVGIDIEQRLGAIVDDEFAVRRSSSSEPAAPFSTTTVRGRAE